MSKLDQLINELYQNSLSESECQKASTLLVDFFKELEKIDQRLKQDSTSQGESNVSIL